MQKRLVLVGGASLEIIGSCQKVTVAPSKSTLCKLSDFRQIRIETILKAPTKHLRAGGKNKVIPLHKSFRWNPQETDIYKNDSTSQERFTLQRSNHLENDIASGYGQEPNWTKSPEE